ncbi:step II splicing factor [Plasmodium gonderi]|uniref:Pre-mRNA-splicing factor SLU7 n=1 Tax=Plasmodium gonderi TaxID=77519 RepID=A0A1Y1JNW6_PLAGO|nr:step II splicing factor [Plasmodium gonderi]GAW82093.1 step II splicing factor [Plasmodium gonderi]
MWINKIGNKSASFINHKHFHPGNIKNLERVWLAEEKERKRKEEEEKYLKKKEEQYKLFVLKQQLKKNEQEEENKNDLSNILYDINKEGKRGKTKKKIYTANNEHASVEQNRNEERDTKNNKLIVKSKYNEDVFVKNHKSVYGSYYDMEKKKWGYKCCKTIYKSGTCTNYVSNDGRINDAYNKNVKKDLDKENNKKKNKKNKKKKKNNHFDNSISAVLDKFL